MLETKCLVSFTVTLNISHNCQTTSTELANIGTISGTSIWSLWHLIASVPQTTGSSCFHGFLFQHPRFLMMEPQTV